MAVQFVKDRYVFIRTVWTRFNDRFLNIETEANSPAASGPTKSGRPWWYGPLSDKSKYADNHQYVSPDYWYLRKVIKILSPKATDVVYDLGAGKGRFLCLMARRRVKTCVGIELLDALCEVARQNVKRLRARKSDVEIVCSDAAIASVSGGTIYFMFNPFGPQTIQDTLGNIRRSLLHHPRSITIVYYNPAHERLFEECGWLEKRSEFKTAGGLRVTFWNNGLGRS